MTEEVSPVTCSECGHFFDPADRRGYVPGPEMKHLEPTCPACWLLRHGGAPAWAVWNNCQGVFACSVFHWKREAEERRQKDFGGRHNVVPVRVIAEPEGHWWSREAQEREYERMRGSQ